MKDVGVLVYTANDSFEASRIAAILESEGIPSYTKELGAGQVFQIYAGFSKFGTEIYVPADAEEQALELIAERVKAEEEE